MDVNIALSFAVGLRSSGIGSGPWMVGRQSAKTSKRRPSIDHAGSDAEDSFVYEIDTSEQSAERDHGEVLQSSKGKRTATSRHYRLDVRGAVLVLDRYAASRIGSSSQWRPLDPCESKRRVVAGFFAAVGAGFAFYLGGGRIPRPCARS